MKNKNPIAKKYGISDKQAEVLKYIRKEETVTTDETGDGMDLNYPDARNQIRALKEVGFVHVCDNRGRTLVYEATSRGRLAADDILANGSEPFPFATNGKVGRRVNGRPHDEQMPARFANHNGAEEVSAVYVVFMGLPEFVTLFGKS